jgi:chromosome segregation ATPase
MEPPADYVHLLVRQLPSIPAPVEAMLATRTEHLRERIVEERLKLLQLHRAEAELNETVARELSDLRQMRQQYKALEPQTKALRKRFTSLVRTEQMIQQRLAELEQADQAIQQPLKAIARRERVTQRPT